MRRQREQIRQGAEGSYELTICDTDPSTGEKKQSWTTFRGSLEGTKKELTLRLKEADHGEFIAPAKTMVGEFLQQWWSVYAEQSVSATCFQRWASLVQHHLIPGLGAIRLSDLRAFHIQRHYAESMRDGARRDGRKGGLKARTILHHYRLPSQAMAVKWNLVGKNPAAGVTLPPASNFPK